MSLSVCLLTVSFYSPPPPPSRLSALLSLQVVESDSAGAQTLRPTDCAAFSVHQEDYSDPEREGF